MAREIIVTLKNEVEPSKPFSAQLLSFINAFIKSPIFVFVFGASLGTAYPIIKDWLTPSEQLALRHAQEQAQADAILIAPFIGNLDANKPGQFEAARAALLALEELSSAADAGKKRPIYTAVNKAIYAVGIQLRPPTDKTQLTNNKIESPDEATAIQQKSQGLDLLKNDTLVYIQVSREKTKSQDLAENILRTLRRESVLAAGIEKLDASTMPRQTQVRYFNVRDKPKAKQLAALVSTVTNDDVFLAKPELIAQPGTLEIWFGTETPEK